MEIINQCSSAPEPTATIRLVRKYNFRAEVVIIDDGACPFRNCREHGWIEAFDYWDELSQIECKVMQIGRGIIEPLPAFYKLN